MKLILGDILGLIDIGVAINAKEREKIEKQIQFLNKQLEEADRDFDFERSNKLREEIRKLESQL